MSFRVAPHWGAWIEIVRVPARVCDSRVAPHWGAWIEIRGGEAGEAGEGSHPTGVRGLKLPRNLPQPSGRQVAPHWGAWIEITICGTPRWNRIVAPHWGAWIEIATLSLLRTRSVVAPHWGAWIEINRARPSPDSSASRTPLGCVD